MTGKVQQGVRSKARNDGKGTTRYQTVQPGETEKGQQGIKKYSKERQGRDNKVSEVRCGMTGKVQEGMNKCSGRLLCHGLILRWIYVSRVMSVPRDSTYSVAWRQVLLLPIFASNFNFDAEATHWHEKLKSTCKNKIIYFAQWQSSSSHSTAPPPPPPRLFLSLSLSVSLSPSLSSFFHLYSLDARDCRSDLGG